MFTNAFEKIKAYNPDNTFLDEVVVIDGEEVPVVTIFCNPALTAMVACAAYLPTANSSWTGIDNKPVIMLSGRLATDKYNDAERLYVLQHEVGHHALGHIKKYVEQGVHGISLNAEDEFAADRYSVTTGGADAAVAARFLMKHVVVGFKKSGSWKYFKDDAVQLLIGRVAALAVIGVIRKIKGK